MFSIRLIFLVLVLSAAPCLAIINPGGVVSAASFAPFGLPNSGIGQGSIFLVFGSDLGGATLAQASSFPLPTELAGTSIQVTVGGQTVDCFMVFTTAGQVAAILPSNTPVGTGTIQVTFNGVVSTGQIVVVATTVGIFTQSQSGLGPGIIQNFVDGATTPLNTLSTSATAGQALIIWASGLGGVAGDEAAGPLPGAKPSGVTVKVFIGGQEAQLIDFGRSGCCAGLDQIVAVVPQGLAGCYVPLVVVTEVAGVAYSSNSVSLAINDGGGTCEDVGIGSEFFTTNADPVRIGILSLGRGEGSLSIGGLGSSSSISDVASGTFFEIPRRFFVGAALPVQLPQRGACTVFTALGQSAGPPADNSFFRALDAGPTMSLQSPGGTRTLERFDVSPSIVYQGVAVATTVLNGVPTGDRGDLFVDPGTHTFSAPGGADVGAFSASTTVPDLFDWTNSDDKNIDRSQPHTVTWTGGNPDNIVLVQGTSTAGNGVGNQVTVSFLCFGEVRDGSLTIPQYVLGGLPVSSSTFGLPLGTLSVGQQSFNQGFTAPGIDIGIFSYLIANTEPGVSYE